MIIMPSAEIIAIGTELLLGEIVDTNTAFIARALRDIGVNLFRTTTVGDNAIRIAQAIQQAFDRAEIVLTTGGLGPTVDDPTREAVALAMGVEVEYHPELWAQIQARFNRYGRIPTENNRRQAYIPIGATAVENPVGTAPAFFVDRNGKVIFSLPGVPSEMEYLLEQAVIPYLRQRFHLQGIIKTRVLHTAGVGESVIDDRIGDLEELVNPTVGLAAHSGQVDVRITAKADSIEEADMMIDKVDDELRKRLGKWIYGVDQETLEGSAMQSLERHGWNLVVVEAGLGGNLIHRLASLPGVFLGGEMLSILAGEIDLYASLSAYQKTHLADVGLGVRLIPGIEKQEIQMILISPEGESNSMSSYGGHPDNAPLWAINHSLDLLRNL